MVDLSAPSLVQLPAFLDLEASGFGRASYPIEVGYVLPDGSSFCTLIRPPPDWTHWDPAAEAIHHITRDMLFKHGRGVREVAVLLNDRLRGQTLYSDGWANDYTWIATLYEEAMLVPSFKLDSLRSLLNEREATAWQSVKQRMAQAMVGQRHRASTDARLLQTTLQALRAA